MGAAVLAAHHGIDLADVGYRRDRALATATINGSITSSASTASSPPSPPANAPTPARPLGSERRWAARWGQIVRPDGYGHRQEAGADVDFFLEYDRGTEPLNRLVDKLDGCADLQTATGVTTTWRLFWLPGPRREAALCELLSHLQVLAATAHAPPGPAPVDAVWLPVPCGKVVLPFAP